MLLNMLPISLEGPLNCICIHVSTKVNILIQKKILRLLLLIKCLFMRKHVNSNLNAY